MNTTTQMNTFYLTQRSPKSLFKDLPIDLLPIIQNHLLEYKCRDINGDIYQMIKTNDILLFKYTINKHYEDVCVEMKKIITEIICNYKIEYICYLHEKLGIVCDVYDMSLAVIVGDLAIIKYLHKNMNLIASDDCVITVANANRLDILQYIHQEMGVTRNKYILSTALHCAIDGNYFVIIEYLHKMGAVCIMSDITTAIKYCDLKIIKYLYENMGVTCNKDSVSLAVQYNRLDVLHYFINDMRI